MKNKPATVEEALEQKMENGTTVSEHLNAAIAKIGEKITLRRFELLRKMTMMHLVLINTWAVVFLY